MLRSWREADPQNEQFYQTNRLIWSQSEEVSPSWTPDITSAWNRFESTQQINKTKPAKTNKSFGWMRVAAVLILAISLSVWIFQRPDQINFETFIVYRADQGSINQLLSDGSTVYLNKGSKLTVIEDLSSSSERVVQLEGEAFFDISRDAARPFLIEVDRMQVKVLGTSFLVRADDEVLEVVVREGKVAVDHLDGSDRVELTDQQRYVLDRTTGDVVVDRDPTENAWSWQTGILQFQATPLNEVIRTIERHYQIQIHLANPVNESCPFTSRFQEADASTVIQSIAGAFGMKVRTSGQGIYYLTDGKCR